MYFKADRELDIAIGFFDILGSAKRIANGDYKTVYDFYEYMIKLCSEEQIPISHGAMPFAKERLIASGWPEDSELVILKRMNHAFFSDTFMIWVDDVDSFGMRLRGFYEKCNEIFVEALKRGIPLRGAISRGKAIMDNEKKIYLGKPIVEAARLESMQNWLGVSLGFSCGELYPTEAHCVIPYTKQYKKELLEQEDLEDIPIDDKNTETAIIGYGGIASHMALNWPRYWRENENGSISDIVSSMNSDERFSSYYLNTLDFISFSNENVEIMKSLEDVAPPMVPLMVRYIDE